MPKKTSESQDAIAAFFEGVAEAIENNQGVFPGEELTAVEARTAARAARDMAKWYRVDAENNRSIGC